MGSLTVVLEMIAKRCKGDQIRSLSWARHVVSITEGQCVQIFVVKPEGKRLLSEHGCSYEYNIKVDIKE